MNISWFLIRGSGFAAFGLLSASVLWGLLVSTKTLGRAVKAKGLTGMHEALGISAVLTTLIHLVAVNMDEYLEFSWAAVLVPGFSTWRPTAISLGVVSFWMMIVVTLSFYFKSVLGATTWKVIHRSSLGVFLAAIAHAVLAGTDSSNIFVIMGYAGATAAIIMLSLSRMAAAKEAKAAAAKSAAPRTKRSPQTTPAEKVPEEATPVSPAPVVSAPVEPTSVEPVPEVVAPVAPSPAEPAAVPIPAAPTPAPPASREAVPMAEATEVASRQDGAPAPSRPVEEDPLSGI